MTIADPKDMAERVNHLHQRVAVTGTSQIIGILRAPGTGKSTFPEPLGKELGGECVIVPMDGFHLANNINEGTPLRNRKGAIDTFDVGGFISRLTRLKAGNEPVLYPPTYRCGLEEPIAASIGKKKR